MSQNVHPLDDELIDFSILKRKAHRIAGRDGDYDAEDRELLSMIDRIHAGVATYRSREVAADAYKRNGVTRHTASLFKESGAKLISLDDERNRRKIVQFPGVEDINLG